MNLVKLVLISLIAGASTGLGGILATIFKPSERNLVFGLSFSSGLMLGVAFLMLMPEALKGGFSLSFIGFIIGMSLFLLLDYVLPHIHVLETSNSLRRLGTLIAIGIAIHDIPEGFGIGAGYGISENLGIAIAIAIVLHNIPEGMAMGIPFRFSGMSRFRTVLIAFGAGMSTVIGALISFFLLRYLSDRLIYSSLSFAAGAMFYITVNELIPEAHKYGKSRLLSLGVLVGIVASFLLTKIG
ncbi:ZIP family metal transporter [Chloroflexota bacterium]